MVFSVASCNRYIKVVTIHSQLPAEWVESVARGFQELFNCV